MIGFIVQLMLLAILIAIIFLALVDRCTSWLPKWFCDHIGWHKTPLAQHFDGCSIGGKCPRCGRNVLADSNGDYFASGSQSEAE